MDSIRTKKSNKKAWIIGGSVGVALLILIIVLCVTLSSGAEEDTGVTVKTIPEALKFVEDAVSKTYEKHDNVKKPLLRDVKILKERLTLVEDLFKAKTHAEDNGQAYDIKIIEEKMATVDFVESEKTGKIVQVDKTKGKETTKKVDTKTEKAPESVPAKDGTAELTAVPPKDSEPADSSAKNLQGQA